MTENQDIVTRELVNTLLNLLLDNEGFGIKLFSENYEQKVILGNPRDNLGWGIYLDSYGGDKLITLGDNSEDAKIRIEKNVEDQYFISIDAKDRVIIGRNSRGVWVTNLEAPRVSTDAANKAYVDNRTPDLKTSGNWSYKVYADGSFDAWYTATGQSYAIIATSGNLYRSELQTLTLPTALTNLGTNITIKDVTVNVSHNNFPTFGMLASISSPSFKYYAMSGGSRPNSPNYTVTAHVFGIGTFT